MSAPREFSIKSFLDAPRTSDIASLFQPPLPPLSGISVPIPPMGLRIPTMALFIRYSEAIEAVSDRLGKDEWFLGSSCVI